jgi:hypothetical protein
MRERPRHAVASGASLAGLDRHGVAGVVPPVAMCQVGVLGVVVSGLMVSGLMAQLHAMGA